MTESMAGNIAGSSAKGFSAGKRKAEDGVRKSGSDTEMDSEGEIQLAKGVEKVTAGASQFAKGMEKGTVGASQFAQEFDVFGEKLENYIALVNKVGTTMKCLQEHKKGWETTKEERKKRRDDHAALIAEMNQRFAQSEEVLRLAEQEEEQRLAQREERRLAEQEEEQRLAQLWGAWHEAS